MLLNHVESENTSSERRHHTEGAHRQTGVSFSYVNRITKGREQLANKTFLKIMDQLGYDVELI